MSPKMKALVCVVRFLHRVQESVITALLYLSRHKAAPYFLQHSPFLEERILTATRMTLRGSLS